MSRLRYEPGLGSQHHLLAEPTLYLEEEREVTTHRPAGRSGWASARTLGTARGALAQLEGPQLPFSVIEALGYLRSA